MLESDPVHRYIFIYSSLIVKGQELFLLLSLNSLPYLLVLASWSNPFSSSSSFSLLFSPCFSFALLFFFLLFCIDYFVIPIQHFSLLLEFI